MLRAVKMTGQKPGSDGGSLKRHKWIALDVKPGGLRCFEANEKLRQIAKALGISLEVFGKACGAGGRGETCGCWLPGLVQPSYLW